MADAQAQLFRAGDAAPAAPVAMLDSGVGGLSVARAFRQYLPEVPIIYVGDSAHYPYGRRPMPEIREAVFSLLEMLAVAGAGSHRDQLVILACNSASAAVLPEARQRFSFPILSLIEGGLRQTRPFALGGATIGLIATEATIGSGVYQRGLRAAASDVRLQVHAAQELVDFVETELGTATEETVRERLAAELAEFRRRPVDCLVLGCSHFGHLRQPIARMLPATVIVDPAFGLAEEAFGLLREHGAPASTAARSETVGLRLYARGPAGGLATRARQLLGDGLLVVRPLAALLDDETGLRRPG